MYTYIYIPQALPLKSKGFKKQCDFKFKMKMRSTLRRCLHLFHSFSMSSMFPWFLLEKNLLKNIVKKQLKQGIGKKTC